MQEVTTVPHQRVISVNKSPTNKQHLYSVNNIAAMDEAAYTLQSKGGFKLYMYLAKNQDKYTFALSSNHFCMWSGLGIRAYNTAFQELQEKGYLIPTDQSNHYTFYDRTQQEDQEAAGEVIVEMAAATDQQKLKEMFKF